MGVINLWSLRFSFAYGWHWVLERECSLENKEAWLTIFSKDEPEISFKLSHKKPKLPKPV